MTGTRRDSQLAFLLGFGMSFLPSFGPFAGILFVVTNRVRLRRADSLWALAALVSGVSVGVHQGFAGAAFGFFQVLGPWAVFRSFSEMRQPATQQLRRSAVLYGLFAGFLLLVAIGLGHMSLNLAYPTVTQAVSWGGNPTLFAHMALVVGTLIALLAPDGWLASASLTLTAVAVVAAGSREAVFALLLVVLFHVVRALAQRRIGPAVAPFLVASLLVTVIGFGQQIGLGRTGYLLAPATDGASVNLVRGSELPAGNWWDSRNVSVKARSAKLEGRTLEAYHVTKNGPAMWYRLQQVIPLHAGTTYTVSAWVLDSGPEHAGIQGWGATGSTSGPFALTTALVDHRLEASVAGPGRLEGAGIAATQGAWKRIYATFEYLGKRRRIDWSVGLAPDARAVSGTSATFAGFQLERGPLTAYRPGPARRGLDFSTGRAQIWRVAWSGIRQRPWLGWGPSSFPAFYRASPLASASDTVVPAHAHDLYFEVLFERGVVGFLGLLLLLAALMSPSIRRRDVGLAVVFAAVLLANVFDYTFFFGGVIYPLAAVAGWRSRQSAVARPAADSLTRQFLVRLALAAIDLGLAGAALALSSRLVPLLGASGALAATGNGLARYALFLWPAMAWREGLYPGYGLTEPDELKRQVLAAIYGGALFLIGALLFGPNLGIDPVVIIGATVLSAMLMPVGRAAAKRALRAIGLWGRPVVIIGSGRSATNIASVLSHRSLDGLRPAAIFGETEPGRPEEAGESSVPHVGPISAANTFARREGIHHAIVAMGPEGGAPRLPKLDPRVDAFTIIQYVPDLPGLPVLGVRASSLDNLLALEVRNELASPVNRSIKRVMDVLAVVTGGIVVSPVLLAIAAAVLLDSRGPLFFAHERIGRGGRKIRVWKFRTMVRDAQAELEHHLATDPALRSEWEASHKLKHDPRVTRVGRFLRRYSLDELPQLWNVLKGEMSLVGPRPIVDAEVPKYADAFDLYGMVRPGMTGYWQISGRSDTDYAQRVELDGFYVRNWSVWLDIVVLLKTVSVVLKRDGAY